VPELRRLAFQLSPRSPGATLDTTVIQLMESIAEQVKKSMARLLEAIIRNGKCSVCNNPEPGAIIQIQEEGRGMCQTCRRHHPELYHDKPVSKPEKVKKTPPKKK
jgi:hypothetical protein